MAYSSVATMDPRQTYLGIEPAQAALRALEMPTADTAIPQSFAPIAVKVHLNRGVLLAYGDAPERSIYRVVSGALRSSRLLADGGIRVNYLFLPGEFFILGVGGKECGCVEAIADSVVAAYSRGALEAAIHKQSRLQEAILRVLARGHAFAVKPGPSASDHTAAERVATFLLDVASRCGDGEEFCLPMGRAEIADHLGLSRETVCRVLSKFEADAFIAIERRRNIRLVDPMTLSWIAERGCGASGHSRQMSRAS